MPTLHRTIMRPIDDREDLGGAIRTRGEYTFEVAPDANKAAIRQAIERLFGVKVTGVWTANMRGKLRKRREDGRAPSELEESNREAPGRATRSRSSKGEEDSRWQFVSSSRSPRARGSARSRISREITRTTPEKSLLEPLKKSRRPRQSRPHLRCGGAAVATSGSTASSTFRRNKFGVPATVREIEYDPNRSARIALVEYADGEKRYILHPRGLAVGDTIVSGPGSDVRTGNALPLREMPLGTAVHNVELKVGKGGQIARSAGDVGRRSSRRKAST